MDYSEIKYNDLGVTARRARIMPSAGIAECHVILTIDRGGATFAAQMSAILEAVSRLCDMAGDSMRVVFKRYYLSDAANQARQLPPSDSCCVSVVEQPPLSGAKIALLMLMQQAVEVRPAENGMIEVSHGRYRHLWQGSAAAPGLHSAMATRVLLGDLAINLENQGCSLANNCVRTWFFVQNVDVNYRGVVNGRNEMFKLSGLVDDTHYIASTGIGGRHADPSVSVEMDSYSVDGLADGQMSYLYAPENMNRTSDYGVAFERGTTVDYGDRRHVYISGTASIDNRGQVLYPDNIELQTARMLENVEALLDEAGCGWDDVGHAVIYLRDVTDYNTVSRIIDHRLPRLPRVIVYAPVCRPGWLIEMECMACKPACHPEYAPL